MANLGFTYFSSRKKEKFSARAAKAANFQIMWTIFSLPDEIPNFRADARQISRVTRIFTRGGGGGGRIHEKFRPCRNSPLSVSNSFRKPRLSNFHAFPIRNVLGISELDIRSLCSKFRVSLCSLTTIPFPI